MGEMPFHRAGFGTGLDHHIFRRERPTEGGRGLASRLIAGKKGGGCVSNRGWHLLHLARCLWDGRGESFVAFLILARTATLSYPVRPDLRPGYYITRDCC